MPITPTEALGLSIDRGEITALAKLDDYVMGELRDYYCGWEMKIRIDTDTPRNVLDQLAINYKKCGWESVEVAYDIMLNENKEEVEYAYLVFHPTIFRI